jgi:hypothetical protein
MNHQPSLFPQPKINIYSLESKFNHFPRAEVTENAIIYFAVDCKSKIKKKSKSYMTATPDSPAHHSFDPADNVYLTSFPFGIN